MVTMLETVRRREMLQGPTEASTTIGLMTEEEAMIEEEVTIKGEMIEEEEMPLMIKKKVIILKRGQGTLGMKTTLLLVNMNILFFMLFLVLPLQIHMMVGR